MKKTVEKTPPDERSENNEQAIPDYWDIEDRLCEQYKEGKMQEIADSQGD